MNTIPEKHKPIPNTYNDKPLVKKYRYFDSNGELIGYVAYYGKSNKSGRILFFEYEYVDNKDGHTGIWNPRFDKDLNKIPLYRSRKVKTRKKSEQIVIVENERSAIALSQIGVCALSPVEGTQFIQNTDWSPLNGIRDIYLIAPNDESGIRFIEDVYMQLEQLPSPPNLKIINIDQELTDDPLDWLQKSYPMFWENDTPVERFKRRLHGVMEDLLCEAHFFSADDMTDSVIQEVKETEKDEVSTDADEQDKGSTAEDETFTDENGFVWPTPSTLKNEDLPVMPMTKEMLPKAIRNHLLHANPGAPLDYIAATAVVVAGSIIGSGCGLCPRASDYSWCELPNLWGAIIGGPGQKKSPSVNQVLLIIKSLQGKYTKQYKKNEHGNKFDEIEYNAKHSVIVKQIKALADVDSDEAAIERKRLKKEFIKLLKDKPVNYRRQFLTNETSSQKMTELQEANPRGVLIFRDELSGLLIDWYGKNKSDRSYYLTGWNDQAGYTDAKIIRGITETENVCISIIGTIQPDKLLPYIKKAAQGDNDGLIQRFQLAVYPDVANEDNGDNGDFDNKEFEHALSIFETLAEMNFEEYGASYNEITNRPYFIFTEKAQKIFNEWKEGLDKKITNELNPLIEQHLSKFPKLFANLALIFHLLELADKDEMGNVTNYAAKLAVKWCEYLESHARRIYAQLDNLDNNTPVKRLSDMILTKELSSPFDERKVYRYHRAGLDKKETAKACAALVEANWLKKEKHVNDSGKGRPSFDYYINPQVYTIF